MDVARQFAIGEGTVQKITDQVITAIRSLKGEYLSWYSSSQITKMKARIYQQSGFPNCVGFLDGTTIVFAEKPVKEGEAYYSRKSDYGINSQIVADLDGHIRYIFTGYPASVHDSRCVRNSDLFKVPEKFFSKGEYVLADSAYTLSDTVLPTFKKPASLRANNAAFNVIHSSMHVKVEHCIGMLKGRFQSLRGTRVRLAGAKDANRIIDWVMACAVVHNMVLGMDQWNFDNDFIDVDRYPITNMFHHQASASAKREFIKTQVLAFN